MFWKIITREKSQTNISFDFFKDRTLLLRGHETSLSFGQWIEINR